MNTNSSVFVQAPFGGYKQSGVGKELGMEALAHNTELKSVFISTECASHATVACRDRRYRVVG